MKKYDLIAILGPTASGKTTLAAHLAAKLNTEIISADSRQVYRRMDLGTGKDLADYEVEGRHIPYHLIDIVEPGSKYNVYQYQQDFLRAYKDIADRGKLPVVCGGSGLYIESVLRGYQMADVPENKVLRQQLEGKSLEELTEMLKTYKNLHNTTDTDTAKRAIRAIEIEEYYSKIENGELIMNNYFPTFNSLIIGVSIDRESRREKISRRLRQRLNEGMVDEVKGLLAEGIPAEDLIYYGLEYKYLTLYATGKITYDEMFSQLEIAIHQFAKRQMTWFRGMERRGVKIHWVDATLPMEEKVNAIMRLIEN
ncbi:MAG: tRNA (adenosine(37)-N6)-dimethylallyltransferase MiaA [Bacteroidaceae bacterium]|nr:tRNA (adenosine(37)-N6)-dimethylallyltransferase MiaA [Bacteroidaceae bacterium]